MFMMWRGQLNREYSVLRLSKPLAMTELHGGLERVRSRVSPFFSMRHGFVPLYAGCVYVQQLNHFYC